MRPLLSLLAVVTLAAPAQAQDTTAAHPAAQPLTLVQAIALGRQRGVNAALSRLSARAADERVGQRRADLLPTINGQGAFGRQTLNLDEFGLPGATGVTPGFTLWRAQLRAQQTLFDASAVTRLRAASDTAAAAGLDARAVGELAGSTAGLAYLRVLSAEETVRARAADSALAQSLLEQARELVRSGVSPAIDETRSEVSYSATLTQLEIARNSRDRARLDLLRTLDVPPATELALADSLTAPETTIPLEPAAAVEYARTHRAELAAERARTRAAQRNLSAIRYENLPSVVAGGAYGLSGRGSGGLEDTYSLQIALNVPILDGFRRQNRAQEQQARLEAQELRERDLGNQIETEAREAILDLASARQQIALAASRLRLADEELAQARERFRAGVAGSIETTNAQLSVSQARDALVQARTAYGTARIDAYRALGALDELN